MIVVSSIFKPFVFIYQFLYRVFWSGLNQRNIWQLPLNFCINFSPIFIWLLIFKNAGIIPHSIRPTIHVKLPYRLDMFMFETFWGSLMTLGFSSGLGFLMYFGIYSQKQKFTGFRRRRQTDKLTNDQKYSPINEWDSEEEEFTTESGGRGGNNNNNNSSSSSSSSSSSGGSNSSSSSSFDIEMSSFDIDEVTGEVDAIEESGHLQRIGKFGYPLFPSQHTNFQACPHHKDFTYFKTLSVDEINSNAQLINERFIRNSKLHFLPINSWHLAPACLFASSWLILNFVFWLRNPIRTWEDLLAWTSYVLGHITVPIVTAVWLYVFHAPGVLKSYALAMGFQNICGVVTHLLFPCAPPWFVHKNGEDAPANYEMLGYAAGLIRVDVALGTHLNSNGFHISPIVFGAVPSLHSAMAVMTFFFVAYYSRWIGLKLLALGFVVLQWWATIYLDHHWRLDLYVGMIYAIIWFTIIYTWRLKKVNQKFIQSRLQYAFSEGGSTMGMRVFRNTSIQWFFDPLA
ncbi:inositolphosphotransferase 1 [Lodderomyces elongisporus]|uniref:inositolphosphotransferase 1 n=1 Tax=Lodderomyces elongisporus TaxID=36914 RepID=UPI00291CA10E|nr:inositolphosphotransferase 1 [Lodderomyces elongisporus]WLF77152.1 inositolphosphotransferase 1 [Lodderomyces elongisporus]